MISLKVIKNFYSWMEKFLFLDGKRCQGIKGITRKINKFKMTLKTFYIPFLFKAIVSFFYLVTHVNPNILMDAK